MKYYRYDTNKQYIGFYNSDIIKPNSTEVEPSGTNVKWNGTTWDTILQDLDIAKYDKIIEVSKVCEALIVAGFTSDALGSDHFYQSDRDDQSNLVGLVTLGSDELFKCNDGTSWIYAAHTAAQLREVLEAGKNVKLPLLKNFNDKKELILACSTQEEIDSIEF